MTSLDELLYAWLAEADDRAFERAFSAYFRVAFPAVVRHLARAAPADSALLEDIAQDALLRFFDRIGRGRRLAAEALTNALSAIRPLPLGALHERHVAGWTRDVGHFRGTVMAFRPTPDPDATAGAWKQPIRELAEQIPPLQSGGWRLIDQVRIALQWNPADASREVLADEAPGFVAGPTAGAATRAPPPCAATVDLAHAALESTDAARAAESRLPGATPFVRHAATVVQTLPRLRVPTNGYLFEAAMSIYLDEYRRRGRYKRGGTGAGSAADPRRPEACDAAVDHPLELPLPGTPYEDGIATAADDGTPPVPARSTPVDLPAVTDPIREWEDAEFFQRFCDYLRAPVAAAEIAYETARARGRAAAELHRRDALAQKFARTMAVLSAIGEGHTQEQTAERLGLTRNQVKYVLESLQEAYARFSAHATRGRLARTAEGVSPHAD